VLLFGRFYTVKCLQDDGMHVVVSGLTTWRSGSFSVLNLIRSTQI
jgi:hypothetical protein